MKKRLLIILGAGASVECGMPGVAEVDAQMRQWAVEYAAAHGRQNYFEAVWNALERHLRPGFATRREEPNFERALSDLAALMHWVRPSPAGGGLRTLVANGELPHALKFNRPSDYGPYIDIKTLLSHLLARLAQSVRERALGLNANAVPMRRWRTILDALRARFDVAIYNLNYDNVAVLNWPGAVTGFNEEGAFEPAAVHERGWNGVMHLHGSVHFSLADILGGQIGWRSDLNGRFSDCDDRSADERSDGRDFPNSTLIAGGFKLDQLLAEPFNSYQSALVRDAARADAVLIGGYGFTDTHVNRALENALRARIRRPPVLVLDRADATTDPLEFRADRWATVVCHSLYATGAYAPPGRTAPEAPFTLAQSATCEVCSAHRVAVWYGGFLNIDRAIDRLADWLDGAGDETLAPA